MSVAAWPWARGRAPGSLWPKARKRNDDAAVELYDIRIKGEKPLRTLQGLIVKGAFRQPRAIGCQPRSSEYQAHPKKHCLYEGLKGKASCQTSFTATHRRPTSPRTPLELFAFPRTD